MTREDIIAKHSDKFSAEPMSGCWLWTAASDKHGYGMLWNGKRMDRAHRMFYVESSGKNIDGFSILHDCDNPACVNPAHLHIGTQAENMKEKAQRGRSGKKLNKSIASCIRLQLEVGRSQRWIAKFWGISQRTVFNIKHGVVWNVTK